MNSTFKSGARSSLKNLWGLGVLAVLIYNAIISACTVFVVGALLVIGPMSVGAALLVLQVSRNQSPIKLESLFGGFSQFLENLVLGLLEGLYIFLWSLLLVIPGIVKMYSYSLCYFIKADNPQYTASECISKSKELMNGNKWRLFCLDVSFIGWHILSAFSLGIGFFFLTPYIMVSKANFYNDIISFNSVARISVII